MDLVPDAVPGGGPMNVAIAAARLGAPAAFVGRVSSDHYGDLIWRHLEANDVDLRACERGPEPTARAIVEQVPQLRFRFEGDGTADTMLQCADTNVFGPGPHIVHGGTLALFRGRTAEQLASMVEQHDGIVSLDPNVRPSMIDDRASWDHFHGRWLTNTHLYRASDEDLDWVWPGRPLDSCALRLLEDGVRAVIVTHGTSGATIYSEAGDVRIAGRPTDVADTVGAGDTFVASVLVSLWDRGVRAREAIGRLSNGDWTEIGRRAVAAAAVTCSRPGANPPFAHELELT